MFRYRSYKYHVPRLGTVYEDSQKTIVEDGVQSIRIVSVRSVDAVSIPHPDEYRLSDLIAAGVSLTPVDSRIIDNAPVESDVAKLDSYLEKKDDSDSVDDNDKSE